MAERRVVITGMGVVSPVGSTLERFWEALCAGQSGIGPITHFDASAFDTKFAGEVKDLNLDEFLSKKEQRRMDPFCHYGISAAKMAFTDSGLDMAKENAERCGVLASAGVGGLQILQSHMDILRERGPTRFSPFMIPQMIANILPGIIAINHGFKGVNFAVVTACATGTNCIGEAMYAIRHNRADVIIAGGAEAAINPLAIGGFANSTALSFSDNPDRCSIPFDRERSGFVMGEGAGALVLEAYEQAVSRGAEIYCEISGYGNTCDAFHITAPAPDSEGSTRAIALAFEEAGVKPDERLYINAHGTSTPLNDKTETMAIKKALGDIAYKVPVSSTKSMTGHMLGAAGAVEAIAAVKAIETGMIPPTIGYREPDPECDLDYVPNKAREMKINRAISLSFGFGGHNSGILLSQL